jgi:hypothetical protein
MTLRTKRIDTDGYVVGTARKKDIACVRQFGELFDIIIGSSMLEVLITTPGHVRAIDERLRVVCSQAL